MSINFIRYVALQCKVRNSHRLEMVTLHPTWLCPLKGLDLGTVYGMRPALGYTPYAV